MISSNTMKNILSSIYFNFLNLEELQVFIKSKRYHFPIAISVSLSLSLHACMHTHASYSSSVSVSFQSSQCFNILCCFKKIFLKDFSFQKCCYKGITLKRSIQGSFPFKINTFDYLLCGSNFSLEMKRRRVLEGSGLSEDW